MKKHSHEVMITVYKYCSQSTISKWLRKSYKLYYFFFKSPYTNLPNSFYFKIIWNRVQSIFSLLGKKNWKWTLYLPYFKMANSSNSYFMLVNTEILTPNLLLKVRNLKSSCDNSLGLKLISATLFSHVSINICLKPSSSQTSKNLKE